MGIQRKAESANARSFEIRGVNPSSDSARARVIFRANAGRGLSPAVAGHPPAGGLVTTPGIGATFGNGTNAR